MVKAKVKTGITLLILIVIAAMLMNTMLNTFGETLSSYIGGGTVAATGDGTVLDEMTLLAEGREMDAALVAESSPTDYGGRKAADDSSCATHTQADIHEKDLDYLRLCRKTGLEAAKALGWTVVPCAKDGALRPIEDIHEELYQTIKRCLEE